MRPREREQKVQVREVIAQANRAMRYDDGPFIHRFAIPPRGFARA